MVVLLPRMSPMAVKVVLEQRSISRFTDSTIERIGKLPHAVTYGAVGGTRASDADLGRIHGSLTTIARRHGFPDIGSISSRSTFDAEAAAWLGECDLFQTGEALRDGVWAFVATYLVADITRWRFGDAQDRYQGGVRNTFQRLWLRAVALDRGEGHTDRWGLIGQLSEDALVQITERPSLGGNPTLARALAEGWVRASSRFGRGAMEDIMRNAAIGIRLRNEVINLAALDEAYLDAIVDQEFLRAANALGFKPAALS